MKKYLLILSMLFVVSVLLIADNRATPSKPSTSEPEKNPAKQEPTVEKGKSADDIKTSKAEWADKLIQKLKSNDLWVRVEVIKKLGDVKNPKVVKVLEKALGDESIDINVEALRALKKIGDKDALKLILWGAILYDLQSLRFYAVKAAAAIDLDKTRDYLRNNLDSPYPDIRANAAESIANLFTITSQGDKKVITDLITVLAHETREGEKKKIADALNTITKANLDTLNENEWEKWCQDNKDTLEKRMEPPQKVVISDGKPVTRKRENKTEDKETIKRKEAEQKFEDFRDKAILDKKPGDESASYYAARSEEGKKIAIDAFANSDTRVLKLVDEALNWLMRHQNKKDFWECKDYVKNCPFDKRDNTAEIKEDYDIAVTGLALLAFLGAGHTHIQNQKTDLSDGKSGLPPGEQYRITVERGLKWLLSIQNPDGSFRNQRHQEKKENMFEQAMAILAISEAHGMTGDPQLKYAAERALAFVSHAKNPDKGWRYTPLCGDNDTSVTGWQVFALKSGKVGGLNIKRNDLVDASRWLDDMTNGESGKVGYAKKGEGSTTITSIGIICRMLLGWRNDSPLLKKGAEIVISDKSYLGETANFYHIYQSTLAMFQMGGKYWEEWNSTMTNYLNETQVKEGCEQGSWSAAKDIWCKSRVYSTALGALSLEVYYRYLPFARPAEYKNSDM